MKFNLPFGYFIRVTRKFKSKKVIIPVGYDCHPAYLLQKTTLRKQSFPFDWMLTDPIKALDFAYSNIQNEFQYFMRDLAVDQAGNVFAKKYPEAAFYHYKDLIKNASLRDKINKRCSIAMLKIKTKPISYLFVISSLHVNSEKAVQTYFQSLLSFATILKPSDELLVYLRFENSEEENQQFCFQLLEKIKVLSQVHVTTFVLESAKYGLWGNEQKYRILLTNLKVDYYQVTPKIKLEKNKK